LPVILGCAAWFACIVGCKGAPPPTDEPPPVIETAHVETSWQRLPALGRPGRVVVVMFGAARGVVLAGLDGTRQPVDDVLNAYPYGHGQVLLAQRGREQVIALAVAGGEPVVNDFHFEDFLDAVADDGDAALFGGYDLELEAGTAQLWNLRTGKGAGLPLPKLELCPLTKQGDISPDGREAIVPCTPCGCGPETTPCRSSLCRLRPDPDDPELLPEAPGNRGSVTYAPDGRLLFATDVDDSDPACRAEPRRCRTDLHAVPAASPSAASQLVRRGAFAAGFSRVSGRMLAAVALDPERRDCPQWPCSDVAMVVVDAEGERRVATAKRAQLPRVPFSLDDRWIAFTEWEGERPFARACPIDASEPCKDFGAGVVTGWVRATEDAAPLDPGLVLGCYAPVPSIGLRLHGLGPGPSEVMQGLRLRIEPAAVMLWLDTSPQGRHFATRFPARMQLLPPDTIVLALDAPPDLPDDAQPVGARLPPLRIDRRLGKLVLRRSDDGTLHTQENFLLDALIGTADGPLALARVECPADAPP